MKPEPSELTIQLDKRTSIMSEQIAELKKGQERIESKLDNVLSCKTDNKDFEDLKKRVDDIQKLVWIGLGLIAALEFIFKFFTIGGK